MPRRVSPPAVLDRATEAVVRLAEAGRIPDPLVRAGIRLVLRERLLEERRRERDRGGDSLQPFIRELRRFPVAVDTRIPNEQHYELPAAFFQSVLGRRLKYSSCVWPDGVTALDAAEEAMLRLTCERARLADGMRVLDLGCGWGSLTLWMAEHYPGARILAVSNSATQREFIEARAARCGRKNVTVVTADAASFRPDHRFDRVVSVEMFEHMRNPEELLSRIAGWLAPDGRVFVHVFAHRRYAYLYETEGAGNWMGRHFFTGGMMPCDALYLRLQHGLVAQDHWRLAGTHYARTLEAWLHNMDRHGDEIMPILQATYGRNEARRWWHRWRMFFLACSELFAFRGGTEWGVSHYLFRPI